MGAMASQITSLTIVYSTVYSGADQRKHQSSASLAFVWGIHWWPVNSPHKWPVTRKMFPFDDVIMKPMMALWLILNPFGAESGIFWTVMSMPWMPMPWLFASQNHQQQCYWSCRIHVCLPRGRISITYINSVLRNDTIKHMSVFLCFLK